LRAWRTHGENRFANMLNFRVMTLIGDPAAECAEDDETCIDVP
jgi:hypothetical protein